MNIEDMIRDGTYEELFQRFDKAWAEAKTLHDKINVWKTHADAFDGLHMMVGDPTAGKPMGIMKLD